MGTTEKLKGGPENAYDSFIADFKKGWAKGLNKSKDGGKGGDLNGSLKGYITASDVRKPRCKKDDMFGACGCAVIVAILLAASVLGTKCNPRSEKELKRLHDAQMDRYVESLLEDD